MARIDIPSTSGTSPTPTPAPTTSPATTPTTTCTHTTWRDHWGWQIFLGFLTVISSTWTIARLSGVGWDIFYSTYYWIGILAVLVILIVKILQKTASIKTYATINLVIAGISIFIALIITPVWQHYHPGSEFGIRQLTEAGGDTRTEKKKEAMVLFPGVHDLTNRPVGYFTEYFHIPEGKTCLFNCDPANPWVEIKYRSGKVVHFWLGEKTPEYSKEDFSIQRVKDVPFNLEVK